MHSAFGASNGTEKSEPVERQLPVYQELVRALKAEAKAIRATRNTQAFINEILEVSDETIRSHETPILDSYARKNVSCSNNLCSRYRSQ